MVAANGRRAGRGIISLGMRADPNSLSSPVSGADGQTQKETVLGHRKTTVPISPNKRPAKERFGLGSSDGLEDGARKERG